MSADAPLPLCCPSCNNLLGVRYGDRFVQRVQAKHVGPRKIAGAHLPTIIVCEIGDGYWRNPEASEEDVIAAFRLLNDRTPFAERVGPKWGSRVRVEA